MIDVFSNHFIRIIIGTAIILAMPFILMQFTDQVDWGVEDFAVIGVLLLLGGFAFELLSRRFGNRLFIGLCTLIVVLYIWAELAVGVFTNLGS